MSSSYRKGTRSNKTVVIENRERINAVVDSRPEWRPIRTRPISDIAQGGKRIGQGKLAANH